MQPILNLIKETLDFTGNVPDLKRRKRLLDLLLVSLAVMEIIAWLMFVVYNFIPGNSNNLRVSYALLGIPCVLIGTIIIFWINQRLTGYWASILFVGLLLLACLLDEPQQIAMGRSLIYFTIPIVLSGLVISPLSSFIVTTIASVMNAAFVYFYAPAELNMLAILTLIFLAFITWLATSNLENTIKHLASANLALRESEERYRTLVEISPDLISVCQPDGTLEMVNRASLETLGFESMGELVGKKIWQFIHPEDQSLIAEALQQLATNKTDQPRPIEFQTEKKDGSRIWLELKTAAIKNPVTGQITSFLGVGRDVTLRKQAEQELRVEKDRLEDTVRESEAAYQSLVDNSDQGLVLFQNNRVLKANQAFARMCNLSLQELYGKDAGRFISIIHPEDRKETLSLIRKVTNREIVTLRHEARVLLENGQVRWGELTFVPISFMGQPAIQITAIDRTERKQTELALARSEERYRALAEAAQDMIFIIDREGRVRYSNQYAANLFKKHPNELLGAKLEMLFPAEIYQRQWSNIQKVFKTGKLHYFEAESIFPQGNMWLSTWLVPLRDPQDNAETVLGIARNITQLKEMEISLRDAKDGLETRVAERTSELNASRERLRELTHQIVTVQEDERHRVSRELHDEAGQILIGLKYRLGEALSCLPAEYEDARQRISIAMDGTDQAMAKIRRLAHDLRPPSLDVAGINLSLQGYCREFSEQTSLPVSYKGMDIPGLSDEISISLYRILQEGLTNIAKHAPQATRVKVTLACDTKTLTLTIADNGPGYQPQAGHAGLGILGIRERLSLLGGHLQILPNGRKGTRLKAVIPLPEGISG